jgi:hypothetical protein
VRKSLRRDEIPELSAWSLDPNSPNNVERDETSDTTASEDASVTTGTEAGVDATGVESVLVVADFGALVGLEAGVGAGVEAGTVVGAGEAAEVVVGAEAEEEVFFAILLLVYITRRALFKYF